MTILGIDVGGSGIKGNLVDPVQGELLGERIRIPTPEGFQPDDIVATIAQIVQEFQHEGPVGVGFPGVVSQGVAKSPPTSLAYPNWVGYPIAQKIMQVTGCQTVVHNDADVAGIAEMHFGAGVGEAGTVMVFTLGTGVGCSLFIDGKLVPNMELGRLYLRGHDKRSELYMAERIRDEEDLSWKKWGKRLNEYFQYVEWLFYPNLIIVGGGVSKKHEKFFKHIEVEAKIVPAQLRNHAGIVGAAMAAVDQFGLD